MRLTTKIIDTKLPFQFSMQFLDLREEHILLRLLWPPKYIKISLNLDIKHNHHRSVCMNELHFNVFWMKLIDLGKISIYDTINAFVKS